MSYGEGATFFFCQQVVPSVYFQIREPRPRGPLLTLGLKSEFYVIVITVRVTPVVQTRVAICSVPRPLIDMISTDSYSTRPDL